MRQLRITGKSIRKRNFLQTQGKRRELRFPDFSIGGEDRP